MGFVHKEMKKLMGKAIHKYSMIKNGDHVMVAISGGKDSLSLLWLLKERIERIPIDYKITAVHIDPGFGKNSSESLAKFFTDYGFDYRIIKTDIGPRSHRKENRENPCFLCSRMRRKLLFELAEELKCTSIAFGHNKDDVIETFFLNTFYSASLSTMLPVQNLFNGKLTVIRPLYLIEEGLVQRYAKAMGWQEIDLGCPSAGISKRQVIKDMLQGFYRSNKKIRGNIFHAIHNIIPEYLP